MSMAQTENHVSWHKLWVALLINRAWSHWFCHDIVENLDGPLNENKGFPFSHIL